MPSDIKGTPIEIMKAISMFDIDEDYDNREARKKLDLLFHELIMNNDPDSKEFLRKFLEHVDSVISDMGVVAKKQNTNKEEPEENGDEVEFPEPEVGTGETEEEENGGEENNNEAPAEEEGGEEEIPDELLSHYNPLIDMANNFIYM